MTTTSECLLMEEPLFKVAAYVRMSTEHQKYSTSNQMDVIRDYASRRGMEIVRVYSDEGKSGLQIKGRESLSRMIADVESGKREFSSILVYDVSPLGSIPGRRRKCPLRVRLSPPGNCRALLRGAGSRTTAA